jgi:hypothetical protein
MKISALRLFNVKRFAGRGVAIEGIGDGVNVLCAVNEFGKSTSFDALHALFFQPHSSTAGDVRSLRPYSGGNPLVEAVTASPSSSTEVAPHGSSISQMNGSSPRRTKRRTSSPVWYEVERPGRPACSGCARV